MKNRLPGPFATKAAPRKALRLALSFALALFPAGFAAGQAIDGAIDRTTGQGLPGAPGAPGAPAAETVAAQSSELVEKARLLDGKKILFEGEAIGDPLLRGDHAWVNVLGDAYAIGIWMTGRDKSGIFRYGSWASSGDRVSIMGTFHRACPEHGGDMDIHADSVTITGRGVPSVHGSTLPEIACALLFLILSAFSYVLWKKRERLLRPQKEGGSS